MGRGLLFALASAKTDQDDNNAKGSLRQVRDRKRVDPEINSG